MHAPGCTARAAKGLRGGTALALALARHWHWPDTGTAQLYEPRAEALAAGRITTGHGTGPTDESGYSSLVGTYLLARESLEAQEAHVCANIATVNPTLHFASAQKRRELQDALCRRRTAVRD